MKANQLIGRWALRTKPAVHPNGLTDRSYMSGHPVKILKVTDTHIVYYARITGVRNLSRDVWDNDWMNANVLSVKSFKLFGWKIFITKEV